MNTTDTEREKQLTEAIQWDKVPRHIAIIMDGNGRWAQERDLPRIEGHRQGVQTLRNILRLSNKFGIDVLTVYAFSTENWKRPAWEVDFLLELPHKFFEEDTKMLMEENIKLRITGDLDKLPDKAQRATRKAMKETENNTGMIFNMALNYGGRSEIIRAVRRVVEQVTAGEIHKDDVDEEVFSNNLFTAGLPDPDLVIRTSGERRISNFLPWQIAYAELSFPSVYWPDFGRVQLMEAIYDFQRRQRRFGGLEDE